MGKDTIIVNLPDKSVPVVILFGPPACGKTMTLVRMRSFLHNQGYYLRPCFDFCSEDYYLKYCSLFQHFEEHVMAGNCYNEFVLMEVRDPQGTLICYIFDAAGEHYFSLGSKNRILSPMICSLFFSSNPKTWVFYTEPHYYEGIMTKKDYIANIQETLLHYYNSKEDKAIILYNKIDLIPNVFPYAKWGIADKDPTITEIKNKYPGLLESFENHGLLKIIKPYTCSILPFYTGEFIQDIIRREIYVPSHTKFAKRLWETMVGNWK